MRHYVLTRSAYRPDYPLEQNRRRLELLERVTAASMRAQTTRHLTWLVLIDQRDPLLRERVKAIESSGLPVIIRPADGRLERTMIHDRPYSTQWKRFIRWGDLTLTTRLDDDDALAPWAMASVQEAAAVQPYRRLIRSLPVGYRIVGLTAYRLAWPLAQFGTLQVPPRRTGTIYDVNHTRVAQLAPIVPASQEPAWLWIRHTMTRSRVDVGAQTKLEGRTESPPEPITDAIRALFPVDWDLIAKAI